MPKLAQLESARLCPVRGYILAGGFSTRMGEDKALVPFLGEPLIVPALKTLRALDLNPAIAGARASLEGFAPVVSDMIPNAGPLSGIHAALAAQQVGLAVILPVDMPLIGAALVALLIARARQTGAMATYFSHRGRMEPFPVVLDCGLLPSLTAQLTMQASDGQRRSLSCLAAWRTAAGNNLGAMDSPSIELLVASGQLVSGVPAFQLFRSANTPADLSALEAVAKSVRSTGQVRGTSAEIA